MRINKMDGTGVTAELTVADLTWIHNALYFYENHHEKAKDWDGSAPNTVFHSLAAQVVLANSLCQYGHADSFVLETLFAHQLKGMVPDLAESQLDDLKEHLEKALKGDDEDA